MKPWQTVDATKLGAEPLTLKQRGDEFLIQVGGRVLMNSRRHGSEIALAKVGCANIRGDTPTVLIGGLGFGHTLRAALDVLPDGARVFVAEISKAVVEWNRGIVKDVSQNALADPRVRIEVADVRQVIQQREGEFHAVLLDVDNGPFAISRKENARLYDERGARQAYAALKRRGRLTVWSSSDDPAFSRTLERAGFVVSTQKAQGHVLFVGDRT